MLPCGSRLTDSIHSAVEEGHFHCSGCSAVGKRLLAPHMLLLEFALQFLQVAWSAGVSDPNNCASSHGRLSSHSHLHSLLKQTRCRGWLVSEDPVLIFPLHQMVKTMHLRLNVVCGWSALPALVLAGPESKMQGQTFCRHQGCRNSCNQLNVRDVSSSKRRSMGSQAIYAFRLHKGPC